MAITLGFSVPREPGTYMGVDPSHAGGGGNSEMVSQLVMFGAIFGIFYFLVIRPQQKKAKDHAKMVESLKVGDEVITASGIYGKIKKTAEAKEYFELEIASGVVVKVIKSQITERARAPKAEKPEKAEKTDKVSKAEKNDEAESAE